MKCFPANYTIRIDERGRVEATRKDIPQKVVWGLIDFKEDGSWGLVQVSVKEPENKDMWIKFVEVKET